LILSWVVIDWEEGEVVYGGGAGTPIPAAGGGRVFLSEPKVEPEETCRPRAPLEAIEELRPTVEPDALRVWDRSLAGCQPRFK
jgi:hypothetical protein